MKAAPLHLAEAARIDARIPTARAGPDRERWPISMLGVPFENISVTAAVTRIGEMVTRGKAHLVATATLEVLLKARAEPELRRALTAADLLLCDSRSLLAASWCLGNPLVQRIRAPDLIRGVMRLCVLRGYRVFVVDGRPGAAAECARQLARCAPGLQIVGTYSPEQAYRMDPNELRTRLGPAHADVLFERADAGAGAWLATAYRTLGVSVCLQCCIGPNSLRSLARSPGEDSMAARVTRQTRVLIDRLTRAAALAPELLQQWCCMSHRPHRRAKAAIVNATGEWIDVDAGVALTRAACDANALLWHHAESSGAHRAIDVSRVRKVDATGLAVLARCRLACQRAGLHCVLVAPTEELRLALVAAQLASWFETAASLQDAHALVPPRPLATRGVTRSLAWCGEIIAANNDDVWQMTSEYVRTFAGAGATLVIIDLSRLRAIDATGAALMVRVKKWACAHRTEVLFVQPQPNVRDTLARHGVDRLLLEGAQ